MAPKAPRLDLASVVEASLAIADAEGLDALTMRRLATSLGVTPMAIYHHVAGKEQLLDLMADESLRALPSIDPAGPWDTELEALFLAFHRLFLAHPALAQVMTQRPTEGPVALRIGEQVLALLTGGGFSDEAAVRAFITLMSYTTGASLYRISRAGRAGGTGRLEQVSPEAAPNAYRLRAVIAAVADDEAQVTNGLRRLIETYR